ncbi:MAG: ABC transporter permease [Cyclobacteriaceae bacterium]|jgi:putative ABC transport system permease protein|nr:ABC transporter permease [Flammeovirgaceae bacterium]
MKMSPPKWADRFLQWYCRPELLEEIQGDAYELFHRTAKESIRKADLYFIWNVFRFFRLKNIRKRNSVVQSSLSTAMLKNILLVTIRNFVRQPGHSLLSILGLSAGLTCALLIMLWVIHETSFDKFHSSTDRLFKVLTHVEADGSYQTYDVASSVLDVSSIPEAETLVSVSTGNRWPHELCFRPEAKGNECIYLNGVYANENLFSVFDFPILQGDRNPLKGASNIAISEKMARLLFNDANPIGKNIKIDVYDVTVASVFKDIPIHSSLQFDFALPYAILQKQWGIDDQMMARNFFNMYIRSNSSISAQQLTEKLNDIRVLTEAHKAQKVSYQAYPLTDWHLKSKFEGGKNTGGKIEYIILFSVIGGLVVLMAVINLVNMATARASLRAKEIGIRKVTGALRSSIAVQFMAESFLLVSFSFILSILITQLVLPYFSDLIEQPISLSILSGNIPIYLVSFLVIISLLAGLYPSFVMSSFQPIRILKNQFASTSSGSQIFRKTLLMVQLSASIIIIVFSGVLYKQLAFITNKNLGFNRSNMIRIEPTFRLLKKFDSFKSELLKNPSIVSVGAANDNPLNSAGANTGVTWPGKPDDLRVSIRTIGCSYDFPQTMGLKVIEGNDFQIEKTDTLRTEVLVTKEAVRIMGLKNPIGEELKFGQIPCVIIGVINDFHTSSLHEALLPVILYRQHIESVSALYVAFQPGATEQSMQAITNVYKTFEPDYTMKYWFQDETFDEIYKTEIVASRLAMLFTVIALSISIIGIIGLATFTTLRKTKEISIRRVFGASALQALSVLVQEFILVLVASMLIAIPLAWYVADHWLQGFAYRTNMPWWIFGATVVSVVALIVSIIWIQGIKTIRTNPTQTLRSE